ncbi:ParB N-terminal domain-containing protein [Streptomyces sp. NPDC045369]|uniref:ParB N-terminal domain-containing protein n=1 Tax=Streptomyces sp. NPDC045369 TaxID=3155732 RepID=UPI00340A5B68
MTVPVGDLRADHPIREDLGSTDKLLFSIKNNDVRDPLIADPVTLQIISGFRRLAVLRQLHRQRVPVVFPKDAAEACHLVRSHLEPQSQHQMPMSVQDRFRLSQRLREFPRPESPGPWRHEDHAGPAVGLSAATLKGLRSAARGASAPGEPGSAADNAQRVLQLMFEALENPVAGRSGGQAVRRLYGYLRSGDCPATLAAACEAPAPQPPIPAQGEREQVPISPARRRTQYEIRRGVDNISGACAGLASACVADLSAEDVPYLSREIRKNRRILRDVLKSLQEKHCE